MKKIINILFLLASINCYPMEKDEKSSEIVKKNLIEQFLDPANFNPKGNFKPMASLPNEIKNIIVQDIIKSESLLAWLTKQIKFKSQAFKHNNQVSSAVFSEDDNKILTADAFTAKIWDVKTGECLQTFLQNNRVYSAAFNKEETKVLTASGDGTAKLWDVNTGKFLQTFSHGQVVNKAIFSNDESKVLTISSSGYTIKLWDVVTGNCLHTFSHDGFVASAVFNQDDSKVLTTSSDRTAKLWDVHTGSCLHIFLHDNYVRTGVFNKDGSKVLIVGDRAARLWDVSTRSCLQVFRHDKFVDSLAVNSAVFSKNESKVLASDRLYMRVWDVNTGKCLKIIDSIEPVFSQDERMALSLSHGLVRIWDINTGLLLNKFRDQYSDSAIFSNDGSKILTASWNPATVKIWDITDIKNIEESLSYLPFEHLILLLCIYETQIINRVSEHRNFINRVRKLRNLIQPQLFPIYKYPHLQKIYDSLNDEIRSVLENFLINTQKNNVG